MAELGAAYLALLVETKDMKRSVQSAMKELGQEVGKSTSKSSNKLMAGVGNAIKKTAKVGALGVAGLGAAVVGLAAKGGISRALAIEDSRAKLDGLGHSAEGVDKIMGDALASVKGTAFGLGEAASAAASAVASGVKPGKDLQRTLKLTGDAATIAGVGFGEMSGVMNKAAATNKVQGDILAQLGDKGIPIVQLLGETMGKTSDEIYKMSEDGAISFANLQDAIESGMGGAALKSGKTFRGAWANVMAALGRGGETVIKPVLDLLRDSFNKAIPIIDNVTNALKPMMAVFTDKAPDVIKAIGDGFKIFGDAFRGVSQDVEKGSFADFMQKLGEVSAVVWDVIKNQIIPALQELGDWVVRNKDWIGALTVAIATGTVIWKLYNLAMGGYTAVAKLVTDLIKGQTTAQLLLNKAWKAHPIGMIITAVFALIAGMIYLYKNNETARRLIDGAWNGIKTAIKFAWEKVIRPAFEAIRGFIFDKLVPAFNAIQDFIKTKVGPIFAWLNDKIIQPVMGFIVGAVSGASKATVSVFGKITDFVKRTLGPVFTWLNEKIIQPVWKAIKFAVDAAANVLLLIFDLIKYTLTKVLGPAFRWLYDNVIKPVWKGIGDFIGSAWRTVKGIFDTLIKFVKLTLAVVFTWLRDKIIKPVFDGIKLLISLWWTGVKILFNAVRDFVRDKLGPIFTWLRDKVIKPVWDGIKSTISTVWNKGIKPIFSALGNFIKDTVAPAFKKGVEIIAGFWDGLKKIALAPINFIIETVYNKGIVGTFNKVAQAIGSKARLKTIGSVGQPKSNSSQGRGFGGTKVQARAKGGFTPRGWTLVGEEGPELVNFASPGMVYTAAQTKMMKEGQKQAPDGAISRFDKDGKGMVPQGGWLSNVAGAVGGAISGAWRKTTEWVRGGLAKAAELILNPVKGLLRGSLPDNGMAGLARDLGVNTIDNVIKWIRGNDKVEEGGDGFAGSYDGALGRFYRPSNGPITSRYGPRWGGFHAGTDIAGGGKTFAALNGIVKYIGWGGGLPGRTGVGIRLDHGKDFQTYYGHNPVGGPRVKVGQQVKGGQHIGYQGATGNVTGVHLHFETLKNGKAVNPETYLHDNGGWHAPGTMSFNGLKKPEAILTPGEWDTADAAIALASAKGGDRTIDMSGSHFGYDPDEVIHRMRREEERDQLMAGLT